MHVTIAICTWNRAELLRQTLDNFRGLDTPDADKATWDVLVVNNNSTDSTAAVLQDFEGKLPLRHVHEARPGLSNARNRLIQEASGDFLLWTDDDVLVEHRWLTEFVRCAAAYPSAAVFGGPIEPWFPIEPDPALAESFPALATGFCGIDHHLPEGPLPEGRYILGANFALRRNALPRNPFDVTLGPSPTARGGGGDELKVIKSLRDAGLMVIWCPALRVKHYVEPERMTLAYLSNYMEQRGRWLALLEGTHGAPTVLGVPRWIWRELAMTSAAHWACQLTGVVARRSKHWHSGPAPRQGAPRKIRALCWQREYSYMQGLRRGFRELSRKSSPESTSQ